jgi:hypothetical protein
MSPISYSKDWVSLHDTFNRTVYLHMGYNRIKLDTDPQKLGKLYYHGIWGIQIQTFTHGYQDFLVPDIFQNFMPKLVQYMEYVKTKILS